MHSDNVRTSTSVTQLSDLSLSELCRKHQRITPTPPPTHTHPPCLHPPEASAGLFWVLCLISRLTGTGLPPSGRPEQQHTAPCLAQHNAHSEYPDGAACMHACMQLCLCVQSNGYHAWVHMLGVKARRDCPEYRSSGNTILFVMHPAKCVGIA